MLPVIAIPDADDARIVFDALNHYYVTAAHLWDAETRNRVLTLLIASHAESKHTSDTDTDTESGH